MSTRLAPARFAAPTASSTAFGARRAALLAALVVSAASGSAFAQGTGIAWANSIEEARAAAGQNQQLVLMHFYSDDCMPCKLLESRVFPLSNVVQAVHRGYVPVKINTATQPQLAQMYNVYTWPTDIITDARGRELFRTVSPQDANRYENMLTSTAAAYRSTMPYSQQIDGQHVAATGPGALGAAMQVGRQTAEQFQQQAQQTAEYGQQQLNAAAQGVGQTAQQAQMGAQQWAQQTGQGVQQYAQQTQQQLQQYAQQTQQYGQQAQQTAAQQAAAAQQTAQQYAEQYAQQFGTAAAAAAGAAGLAQAPYGQADANPSAADGTPNPYASAPYGEAGAANPYAGVDPSAYQGGSENSGANPYVAQAPYGQQPAAPPYGQMTQNPYVQQQAQQQVQQPVAGQVPPQYAEQPAGQYPVQDPAAGPNGYSPAPAGQVPPQADPAAALAQQTPVQQPTTSDVAPYQPAANPKPIGLDGHCPVTLMTQKKWAKGDVRYGAIHRGRTYLFASDAQRQQFLADPDRFSPMLSGYDPVVYQETGQLVEGKREHGLTYMNHMFLFKDEPSLQRFCDSRDFYLQEVRQAMIRASSTMVR